MERPADVYKRQVLVYADPDLIHQVAYNILDNAIKFTPAGGTIKFHEMCIRDRSTPGCRGTGRRHRS